MQVLHEVSVEYPDSEDFIEYLKQKFKRKYICRRGSLFFVDKLRSKKLAQQTFVLLFVVSFRSKELA